MKQRKLKIANSKNHLMWFAQVSDMHISKFQDNTRALELLELCDFTLRHINPSVILATGDLTDAKKRDLIGSQQFKEEWIIYREVLKKCSTIKRIPWLDIRGNHDNFDVPDISSRKNYFRDYSMQGKNHSQSYIHKFSKGSESYAFIGVDACPAIGLKRPFNFVGVLPDSDLSQLTDFYDSLHDVNYTFWFGHYPTSCILSPKPGIKSVIGNDKRSIAYFCGHFHNMLGFVPNMYTLQKNGFYELELADWKDNRMFRIAAIDHGLFSFIDVKHNHWPIVLVTNPKHALFKSIREPLDAMATSTHIRLLVFSPEKIISVRIRIDSEPWGNALRVSGPLYAMAWKPQKYISGMHNIHIEVLDRSGRLETFHHPFSLDGTRLQFNLFPRMLLMIDFGSIMQVLYGLAVISCVLPYCFLRYMNKQVLDCKKHLPCLRRNTFVQRWLRRIWIISNINTLFYPIILYPIYITIGPWAVAEVLDGNYGIIFIWGIFVNGTLIPESFTYSYGFLQLFLFHGPLVSFTAYSLDKRLSEPDLITSRNKLLWVLKLSGYQIPYLALLLSQLLMAYAFYLAYGSIAVLFGPMRLWPIVLVFWVWYHSKTLSLHKMRVAAKALDRCSAGS
ncbi:transmembrane protein 62 isoform X2 [Halyomorpha halys]|nr:transmembrane protein 62-like isoform X2 [Halyomorpha halys]